MSWPRLGLQLPTHSGFPLLPWMTPVQPQVLARLLHGPLTFHTVSEGWGHGAEHTGPGLAVMPAQRDGAVTGERQEEAAAYRSQGPSRHPTLSLFLPCAGPLGSPGSLGLALFQPGMS